MAQQQIDLLDRARSGDAEALAELIRLHQEQLRQFFKRRVPSEEDAEDLYQETMLRFVRNIQRLEIRSTLAAWLRGLAKHLVADLYRGRQDVTLVSVDEPGADIMVLAERSRGGVRRGCDLVLQLKQCARCIRRTLPLEQECAVLLSEVLGFSDKEASARLGRPLGAYKYLLHEGRGALDRACGGVCALVHKTGQCASCPLWSWSPDERPCTAPVTKHSIQRVSREALLNLRAELLCDIASLVGTVPWVIDAAAS